MIASDHSPIPSRGAIWYQGESNASRAQQYKQALPRHDRRLAGKQFGTRATSRSCLSSSPTTARRPNKVEDTAWAHLRDAQLHTLRTVKNTGMAVTIDIGEANDIHPKNKQDVGKRLARWALRDTYGKKDVVMSGPVIQNDGQLATDNSRYAVVFKVFGSKLIVRDGGQLQGFTVAAKDGKFVKANARIYEEANGVQGVATVFVWSDQVKNPVAVRYAWENNPTEANLVNEEGLPASPFRTDDWKGPTDGRR